MQRNEWLGTGSPVGIKYLGCEWGIVDSDNGENLGCMPGDSEDGTTSWYQMANCRRAQVVYSMYSSSGSTNCRSGHFKESFITKNGVAEFAYILETYGYNAPSLTQYSNNFPICNQNYDSNGNTYYESVGCTSNGAFTIEYFTDAYCLSKSDYSYSSSSYSSDISSFNSAMNNMNCYSADDTTSMYLIDDSYSCSNSESSLCTTSSFVANSGSGAFQRSRSFGSGSLSFSNRVKYTMGSAMLLGSVIMFVGILFTNRRKRHAIMHRKFRQTTDKKKKKKRSSSKSGGKSSGKSSSKSGGRKSSNSGVFA